MGCPNRSYRRFEQGTYEGLADFRPSCLPVLTAASLAPHYGDVAEGAEVSEILFPRGSSFAIVSRELGADGIMRIVMRQLK